MKYLNLLFLIFAVAACSSTEKAVKDLQNDLNDKSSISESGLNLEALRSSFADAYAYRENKIPEAFNRIKVKQEVEKNLYEGYRIQIYSGQDVNEADTIAADFRSWADTTIVGYQPDTYVFFRTPYFKVHVGDFHDRERAIKFSNIVKRYYRDAWVVYDKVNPYRVPADTTQILTQ